MNWEGLAWWGIVTIIAIAAVGLLSFVGLAVLVVRFFRRISKDVGL